MRSGFTLIEMVFSMMIISILTGVSTQIISQAFSSYTEFYRKTRLINEFNHIDSYLDSSLGVGVPTSPRTYQVSDGTSLYSVLEFSPIQAFIALDANMQSSNPTSGYILPRYPGSSLTSGTLIVGPNLTGSQNIYATNSTSRLSIIAFSPTPITTPSLANISLSSSSAQTYSNRNLTNPNWHRGYMTQGSQAFICYDNELRLYRNIAYSESNPTTLTALGSSFILVSKNIAKCEFSFDRNVDNLNQNIIDVAISIGSNDLGFVTLFKKVRINNAG